jgi:hypothetical protein
LLLEVVSNEATLTDVTTVISSYEVAGFSAPSIDDVVGHLLGHGIHCEAKQIQVFIGFPNVLSQFFLFFLSF